MVPTRPINIRADRIHLPGSVAASVSPLLRPTVPKALSASKMVVSKSWLVTAVRNRTAVSINSAPAATTATATRSEERGVGEEGSSQRGGERTYEKKKEENRGVHSSD